MDLKHGKILTGMCQTNFSTYNFFRWTPALTSSFIEQRDLVSKPASVSSRAIFVSKIKSKFPVKVRQCRIGWHLQNLLWKQLSSLSDVLNSFWFQDWRFSLIYLVQNNRILSQGSKGYQLFKNQSQKQAKPIDDIISLFRWWYFIHNITSIIQVLSSFQKQYNLNL